MGYMCVTCLSYEEFERRLLLHLLDFFRTIIMPLKNLGESYVIFLTRQVHEVYIGPPNWGSDNACIARVRAACIPICKVQQRMYFEELSCWLTSCEDQWMVQANQSFTSCHQHRLWPAQQAGVCLEEGALLPLWPRPIPFFGLGIQGSIRVGRAVGGAL